MPKGAIIRLVTDRGFGFIRTAAGKDFFFHRSEVMGILFVMLREGQEVQFEVGKGRDGRTEAVKVRLAQPKGK